MDIEDLPNHATVINCSLPVSNSAARLQGYHWFDDHEVSSLRAALLAWSASPAAMPPVLTSGAGTPNHGASCHGGATG